MNVTHVSIFTRDVETLPSFYVDVFGFSEALKSRSWRYRELDGGSVRLGFPYIDAYATLGLDDEADPEGVRSIVTLTTPGGAASVDALTAKAVECGARLVKPPFETSFRQYLSVILDPEGNAIRISSPVESPAAA